jgi:hypothetical protein
MENKILTAIRDRRADDYALPVEITPISEALHMLSLDLVKMVYGYLVFPTATVGAKARLLFTIVSARDYCHGIAISPDNNVWVSSWDQVRVHDADGQFLFHAATKQFEYACGISFAANGDAYIADCHANCVVVCRADGSFVRRFGSEGRHDGQFQSLGYVLVDRKRELLWLSDNHRVQVLQLDGSFVRTIGSKGSGDGQFFDSVRGIAMNSAREIAVADGLCRVQV